MSRGARTNRPENAAWERVKHIPGLTYRKFDYWAGQGYIHCGSERGEPGFVGSGVWRTISDDEVAVLAVMARLAGIGVELGSAERAARQIVATGRAELGGLRIELTP